MRRASLPRLSSFLTERVCCSVRRYRPGTSSEALARGLVLVIVNPIPGQEERNSDHLLEDGVAIRCNNLPALAYKIDSLLGDRERYVRMRKAASHAGRPNAAQDIVALMA